jgi:hypothetical protein
MAAAPLVLRKHHDLLRQGRSHGLQRCRLHARHVAGQHQPAGAGGALSHAGRDAVAHAPRRLAGAQHQEVAARHLSRGQRRELGRGHHQAGQLRGERCTQSALEHGQAVERLFKRTGLGWNDIDLVELNEAFAPQVLAVLKGWGWDDRDRLNVNGSGISLGHPIGATGGRILANLLRELHRRDGKYGLETMCIGGGQGIAAVFERA